ncbi:MAG: biopolymer transporter ExbD [Prevotellaceae bacterium]|jgi:biopolymer transport protein ExbD|nr:biopolymer transporter ExbD [Prevotellaceae bacterium]
MAIKRHLKIDASFSVSSMSDLVFLLLIFFMITSTMVSPNALKLLLPQSSNQVQAKPAVSVSIRHGDPFLYVDGNNPVALRDLEFDLLKRLQGRDDPTVSIHAERTVAIDEVVKVMNVAKERKWKVILATSPENK